MAGKFNLDNIVAHIKENPLLKPNRYELIITGPPEINMNKDILMNCNKCDIPGHSIESFDTSIVGPKRKIPNGEIFGDISTTFYNSQQLNEFKIINKWMKMISGNESYRLAYYNDIVSDMNINVYNLREKLTANIQVYETYPIGLSEIELSYAGELPSEIVVNWAFHSFEIFER